MHRRQLLHVDSASALGHARGMNAVAEAGERSARPRPLVHGFAGLGVLLGALALELKTQHIERIDEPGPRLDSSHTPAGVVLSGLNVRPTGPVPVPVMTAAAPGNRSTIPLE